MENRNRIDEFFIGQSASITKQFKENDVSLFAGLSLDTNPVHLDADYASSSIFGKRIVHGFLSGSLISAVIGTQLPGPGSIYLNQMMNFRKPVYHDDTITANVVITDIIKEKSLIKLETTCSNQQNEKVIEGSALIKLL